MEQKDPDGKIFISLGKASLAPLHYHVDRWLESVDADLRRSDGCRTVGYSQLLVLRDIMHNNIQMEDGLRDMPKVSDRVSLIGGSGMGGYVQLDCDRICVS
jgi:hypothetical protein